MKRSDNAFFVIPYTIPTNLMDEFESNLMNEYALRTYTVGFLENKMIPPKKIHEIYALA